MPWRAEKFWWLSLFASSPTIICRGGTFETHKEGPNGRWEGVALLGAQNELNFCSGSGNLAPATHVGLWQRGYCRVARAGSNEGCICNPFDSAPPRSYDSAGRGGNSVELNWGTRSVGCEKKLKGGNGKYLGLVHLTSSVHHFVFFNPQCHVYNVTG